MQKFTLEVLGTRLSIDIDTSHSCERIFLSIETLLHAFEQKYSRFIPGNWLDELNRKKGGRLDLDASNMLSFALELAKKTNGAFDPTVGSRLSVLGYGTIETIHTNETLQNTGSGHGSYKDIEFDGEHLVLHGVDIEFGGVGKGYALDKIVSLLDPYERVLVNFGGDIYARGGWNIGLEDPEDEKKIVGTIRIQDGFFCSSSGYKRKFYHPKFGESHHLLDGISGESVDHILATYIESSTGMRADGYATACFVSPLSVALDLLQSSSIEGVLLDSERRAYMSKHTLITLV